MGDALDFLSRHLAEAPGDHYAIVHAKGVSGSQRWVAEAFRVDEVEAMAAWCEQRASVADVYLSMGLYEVPPPYGSRGTADRVSGVCALWMDVDVAQAWKTTSKNYPPSRDAAMAVIEGAPAPVSAIVDSGYGYQAYWHVGYWPLTTPEEREAARQLVEWWQATVMAAAPERWSYDATADIARVLRVPGTKNHKQAKLHIHKPTSVVRVGRDEDGAMVTYDPADLAALATVRAATPAPLPSGAPGAAQGHDGAFAVRLDAAPPEPAWELLCEAEERCTDYFERRGGRSGWSDSEYDLALASFCDLAGWSDQQIVDLLVAARRDHGMSKDAIKKCRHDYFAKYTLPRARRHGSGGDDAQPRPVAPVDTTTATPAEPPSSTAAGEDDSDAVATESAQEAPDAEPAARKTLRDRIVPLAAFRAVANDAQPAIIPGVLQAGAVAIMSGEPKVGKSWMAMTMALAVANGTPWMERYTIESPGRVLYIANEGGAADTLARFDGLSRFYVGCDNPDDAYTNLDILFRDPTKLDDAKDLKQYQEISADYQLIVVDVLAEAWSGDENDNKEVRKLLDNLRSLTIKGGGPAVMVLHHFGKVNSDTAARRTGQRIRGAGAFHASADNLIYLLLPKDAPRVTVEFEGRSAKAEEGFTFALPAEQEDGSRPINLDWQPGSETVTNAKDLVPTVVRMCTQELMGKRALRDAIEGRNDYVDAAINIALSTGQIVLTEEHKPQQNGRVRKVEGYRSTRQGVGAVMHFANLDDDILGDI